MSPGKLAVTTALVIASAVATQTSLRAEHAEGKSPGLVLGHIRAEIQHILAAPQPPLYHRHLQSVLALCEESILELQFAGAEHEAQAKELLGYLKTIESGLNRVDEQRPEAYLVEGRRSLDLARVSRSDGTLQFYTVSLPARWDANMAYPLYVQLHGRWSDLPLALVASTFSPQRSEEKPNDTAIIVVPWLRGNEEWRMENGSEPDIWEAIDDLKKFAKIDSDRQYISGHSWGGDDVWVIVLRTPDLWAAAGIMAGSPIGVPSQPDLVANAQHVPFYLWKGVQDNIPDRQTALEYFRDSLTQVGDPPMAVIAKDVGHNPGPEDGAALQSWLFEHVRHRPNHFSFVIDTAQHRGIWGISIPQKYPGAYLNVEPRISFECWIENSTLKIQTSGSGHIDVDLGSEGLNMSGIVKVIVNGKQMFDGPVPSKPVSLTW